MSEPSKTELESIADNFPKEFEPRESQKEVMGMVEDALRSGYKKIVISAPTGIGKSFIGAAIGQSLGEFSIITATKHLQDQYAKDLPFLYRIKGKSNFVCRSLVESEQKQSSLIPSISGTPLLPYRIAQERGLTCDKGICTWNVGAKSFTCEYKPQMDDVVYGMGQDGMCDYYMQKFEALASPRTLWNYAMFFQLIHFNFHHYGRFITRDVTVFDEAHKIEDQLLQFIGHKITAHDFKTCELKPTDYDLTDKKDVLQLVTKMKIKCYQEKTAAENRKDGAKYNQFANAESKFKMLEQSMVEDPENFILNAPVYEKKKSNNTVQTQFKRHNP